jgi:predicted RNA methylase
MEVAEISEQIQKGLLVPDADFDAWLPEAARKRSARYWTQVGVAMRVSRWLEQRGVSTVLDVGSGAGKFCVVGALSSAMRFTGVEQRGRLVEAARGLAERFDVSKRVSFVRGPLDMVDFADFDALYFYNPFGENLFPDRDRLDDTVEVSRARFERDVAKVEYLLGRMPIGAYVVTYNSCGARIPDSFDLIHVKTARTNLLRLWRKARDSDAGGYFLELSDSTPRREPGRLELIVTDHDP